MIILIITFDLGNQYRMRRDLFETIQTHSVQGSFWSCKIRVEDIVIEIKTVAGVTASAHE